MTDTSATDERSRGLEKKGGYTGGKSASEMRPPAKVPSATLNQQSARPISKSPTPPPGR